MEAVIQILQECFALIERVAGLKMKCTQKGLAPGEKLQTLSMKNICRKRKIRQRE